MKMLKKKNPNAAQYKSCGAAISLVNLSERPVTTNQKINKYVPIVVKAILFCCYHINMNKLFLKLAEINILI